MPTRAHLWPIAIIAVLSVAALIIVWPSQPERWFPSAIPWPAGKGISIGSFERKTMRLGLDLQGGTRLLLDASLPPGTEGDVGDAMDGTIRVLRKRVDSSGVSEAEITRQGNSNISVQLPGLTPDKARDLLGRTALLQFCQQGQSPFPDVAQPCDDQGQWVQAVAELDGKPVPLTSRFLKPNAFVGTDQLGNPVVDFEWNSDGAQLSKQVTQRLLGQPLGIFLDNEALASPNVNGVIEDRGQITGLPLTTTKEGRTGAKDLVIQLNSGALPVQLTVLQEQNVDATLGDDAVRQSVVAGEIGLLIVILFMVLYYRVPGILASVALIVYTLLSLAIFKLIPVTMTLAGIGAFVLSVGMAVDANILVFERLKEEMREGRSYATAIEAGFARAWPSIRDSNVTTLITTLILYVLGGGLTIPGLGAFEAPLVQGFALTLAAGVLVSMFSAIFVTRALMRLLIGTSISRQSDWLGADMRPIGEPSPAGGDG
ncbi:MAG: protein translocase subunit SecD [Dehalococcoidia bacterium]|nr:protein translocase subunit SecD [Dehalococcoidia bacterium]HRC62381.1 protein translocase subunit SecD [Dehalococcoidia bacterium]